MKKYFILLFIAVTFIAGNVEAGFFREQISSDHIYDSSAKINILLDSNESPWVGIINDGYGGLEYTRKIGDTWQAFQHVDVNTWHNNAGKNFFALDKINNPSFIYTGPRDKGDVVYSSWDGVVWSSYTFITDNGLNGEIYIDNNNITHISYSEKDGLTPGVIYSSWTAGIGWSTATVTRGLYSAPVLSVTADNNSMPGILFNSGYELKYASWTAGIGWSTSTIDSNSSYAYNSGDVKTDNDGIVHVAYVNTVNNSPWSYEIKYASKTSEGWNKSVIEACFPQSASLSLSKDNRPYISYTSAGTLKFAKWVGIAWSTYTASVPLGYGVVSTSIVVDSSDTAHMGYIDAYKAFYCKYMDPPNAAPTNFRGINITSNTINWEWVDNSTNEDGFRVRTSTGGLISGDLLRNVTFWLETTNDANTQCARYAEAFNAVGDSVPSTTVQYYTLANPPINLNISNNTTYQINASWDINGNISGTKYILQCATAAVTDGTELITSTITTNSEVISGLLSNTTYWMSVYAVNGDSIPSIATNPKQIATLKQAPVAGAFSNVGTDRTRANWTDTLNPADTLYRVYQSSWNGFTGTVVSSDTFNHYADFAGLSTNTTYWYEAGAVNDSGINWTQLGSKVTLSTAPVSSAYSNIGKLSFQANWEKNGNPGWTAYVIRRSTWDGFAGTTVSSQTYNTNVLFSGLTPDTTYWCQIKAVNNENISSDWTSLGFIKTVFKQPGTIINLVAAKYMRPGWVKLAWTAPGDDGYAGTAASYIVKYSQTPISADSDFAAAIPVTGNNPQAAGSAEILLVSGLTLNTRYYFAVKSIEQYGSISLIDNSSPRANAYSGSDTEGFYVDAVNGSDSQEGSQTAPWKTLQNAFNTVRAGDWVYLEPGNFRNSSVLSGIGLPVTGTAGRMTSVIGLDKKLSKIDGSSDGIVVGVSSVVISGVVFNTPLGAGVRISSGCVNVEISRNTFYGCQYAIIFDIGTPSSIHAGTRLLNNIIDTPINIGVLLRNDAGGNAANKVTVKNNIFRNGNGLMISEGALSGDYDIKYNCFYNSTVIGLDLVPGVDLSSDPQFADVTGHDYHLKSKTGRWTGSAWIRDYEQSLSIDAGDPGMDYSQEPSPNGSRMDMGIYGGTIEASKSYKDAQLLLGQSGEPTGTSVTLQYSQGAARYRVERSQNQIDWTGLTTWDTNVSTTVYTDRNLTPGTTYFYRVAAYNDMGTQDNTYSNVLQVVTKMLQIGVYYVDNTVSTASNDGVVKVTLPANSVSENFYFEVKCGKLDAGVDSLDIPGKNGTIIDNGIVSIKLYSASTLAQMSADFGSKEAIIEVPFKDADGNGAEDRTGIPVRRLTGYKYVNGQWAELDHSAIELDQVAKIVRIRTKSFSIYGIGGIKFANDLNALLIYPNPWKPNSGGKFSGNSIIFDNLTKDSRVRVVDLTGAMWLDATVDESFNGKYAWDGRSHDGATAGSGTYLYIVTDGQNEKKRGKLTVIR